MNAILVRILAVVLLPVGVWAAPRQHAVKTESAPAPAAPAAAAVKEAAAAGALVFRELRYDGRVTDDEARFSADITLETLGEGETSAALFEGELALLPPKLPSALRIERVANQYRVFVAKPGRYQFKLELIAKITRGEPWNQISFQGPVAAIASVGAQAAGADVDLQLLSGTLLEANQSNGTARVKGFLGADQTVSLRWSRTGGVGEVAHSAVVMADTGATAQITPSVIKYVTQLRYNIMQGKLSKLKIALPATHTLARLAGDQIRDWEIKAGSDTSATNGGQILEVQFIKPLEKEYLLTLYSEQTVENATSSTLLAPPQPLEIERETGTMTVSTEDTVAEIESSAGLRQINAAAGALAAYRFNSRPFALGLKLKRIEPLIRVADRVSARMEETRLLAAHSLTIEVEKAGIYSVELLPQAGFVVADVRGEGVEDWKLTDAPGGTAKVLRVSFSSRVLGTRKLEVQLEQALKVFPEQVTIAPLRVSKAARETAQIGAGSAPGIRLKTAELAGAREVPIRTLPANTAANSNAVQEELLAYSAEQADWKLSLAAERLEARIVAEIFNLVTIGDGIVGGSATIRYGLINQGVQEFNLSLPGGWKNVEFTGPNIRRKEQRSPGLWTIALQEKAWGGYTLVVTYDYQFDPKGAMLPIGGIHGVGIERETGSIAITTAASLKLNASNAGSPLRRVDEAELAAADRALITRAVLLAYQYSEPKYDIAVEVKRFQELPVLSAVADRTQLTTVLTEAGEMLTQASFMVKNNDKQFQRFKLPAGAKFWSCYLNRQPVKAEQDNDWLMVPLPRGANRDEAFGVDIVYAEKKGALVALLPRTFQLEAPQTDVPNTYAEWQLFAPPLFRLSGFGGNMTVARGTTYDLRDAWEKFLIFYHDLFSKAGPGILGGALLLGLVVALIGSAVRRGWNGVLAVLGVSCALAILGAMMLPALAKAKARAQRVNAYNNLKQIGIAMRTFSLDNGDRFPTSYEEMMNELSTDKLTIDPESGQRFVYVGGNWNQYGITPDSVVCYSPTEVNGLRAVLLADGSVQSMNAERFAEASLHGFIKPLSPGQIAQNQQAFAVQHAQFQTPQPGGAMANANGAASGANPAPAIIGGGPAPITGAHSIRIEIPRAGQAFVFTKVLNIGRERLSVRAHLMRWQTFRTAQMLMQLTGFLAGLVLWYWAWRNSRNSLLLTFGIALIAGSVGSLLLAWRLLHAGLILLAPAVALGVLGWLLWKYWPRSASAPAPLRVSPGFEPGIPPAVATIALLLFTLGASASESPVPVSHPASATILSADYTGTINDRVAQLDATIHVSAARAGQTISLFGDDVVVQQFTARPADAKLVREGKTVAVVLHRRGEATLQVKLLVKLGGDITRRQLAFNIPPALTSQLAVTIDQPDADVDFPTAISHKRTTNQQQTRVEAVVGASEHVELRWTPRVKRAAEIAANVICHNATLVTFGSGAINSRSILDYQITQGELRQARVRLPAGQRLLRVEGDSIRTWAVEQGPLSEQILLVELAKGVAPGYRLTLETEMVLDGLPAIIKTEVAHALETKRETGLIAVQADEELELAVERSEELQRVDAEEFARLTGQKVTGALNTFRFLKTEFDLQTRVTTTQPQIEVMVRNQVRVGPEQVILSAMIDYTIKRAGVFTLQALLPEGYRIEAVTGNNILQWTEGGVLAKGPSSGGAEEAATRNVLEIRFKERTLGTYPLRIELTRSLKELPSNVGIPGVHPLGTRKLTGYVSVMAEPGVAIKLASSDGLTEIPANAIPGDSAHGGGSVLGYKFIVSDSGTTAPWKLSVGTEAVESWIRAEIVNTLTLTDSLLTGKAVAQYEIQNAPVKELRFRIPAEFRNVEISGQNIRRRDHEGGLWKVEFQNKVRGLQTLSVTWDQPRPGPTNLLDITGVSADGVERETGIVAIIARAPWQVTERSAKDLKPIDVRDLPEWAGRPDDATVLAYRYVRPGYNLSLEPKRFEEAEVLQALVENVNLTTVVADDGQMMTQISLSVRNQGRQHLEVTLPAGATVWSAFVAGQAVRPSVREDKLLLPLEHSNGDDTPIAIELTYVGATPFPQHRGAVELISPRLDVPLKSARWELFLPPDYQYRDFGGTMTREIASAASETSSFSWLDYNQRESRNKVEMAKEFKSDLSNAQQKLSSGNVKEALTDYNRARSKGNYAQNGDADAKKLEANLRRAQGSNLINAQNAFINNGFQLAEQRLEPGSQTRQVQYDETAAEAQWAKLQQAQELGLAKVQPIRVSLPTRGLRHGFTQVLQAEAGKPMTIRLMAANEKVVSWPGRVAAGLGGFLLVWIIIAVLTRKGPARGLTTAPA